MLTMRQRQALTATIVRRYQKASKKEKTKILNEFVANTGYNRSYARRAINQSQSKDYRKKKRKKVVVKKKYDLQVKIALTRIWVIQNYICGKRLQPFIPELLRVLKRDGELAISPEVEFKLLSISAATIDRLLAPTKRKLRVKGISGTKPGSILKSQILVRTFDDWDDLKPGFFELDSVAFCGDTLVGHHVWGLNFVDVFTGWVGLDAVMGKGQHGIHEASKELKSRLPFSMLGLDPDNGTEFINYIMKRFCEENNIAFTRIRPGKKNDNCYVEQKNYTVLRNFLGYQRYDTKEQLAIIKQFLRVVELYVNFFQPSQKLISKTRVGAKVTKRYDQAQTPYQRLLKTEVLDEKNKQQLCLLYESLNPVQLQREMTKLHHKLQQTNRYKLNEATNAHFRYLFR
jgi:hypothetical protein